MSLSVPSCSLSNLNEDEYFRYDNGDDNDNDDDDDDNDGDDDDDDDDVYPDQNELWVVKT